MFRIQNFLQCLNLTWLLTRLCSPFVCTGRMYTLFLINLVPLISLTKGYLYPNRISSGLYEEKLDNPIFYESFVTILYEFKIPSWKYIDITLRDWRDLCTTDEFAPSYTCPVFFYLERFIERLQSESISNSTVTMVPSILQNITDKCDKIQRHFPSMFTSKSELDVYINSTSFCPLQGNVIKRGLMDYVYDIKKIYKSMLNKFENEFSTKAGTVSITDRNGPAYVNHNVFFLTLLINIKILDT